jgi:phosphonate transport system permease protein
MASESINLVGAGSTTQQRIRSEQLSPIPRISVRMILTVVALILVFAWGMRGTKASPGELIAGLPQMGNLMVRMFPPKFDMKVAELAVPEALQGSLGASLSVPYLTILPYVVETLQMALIGTLLAVILALPLGLLAARNVAPHPTIYQVTRLLLNINRAVPDIIFALLFVAAVGLGPFGGVLALGIGSVGSLAKLYAESFEAIDPARCRPCAPPGRARCRAFCMA